MYNKWQNSFIDNSTLELIILPTEQCNFRCAYCYEQHSNGSMSKTHIESIKKLLTKRSQDLQVLRIGWFGGEPLLAVDIIFNLLEHVKQLKEDYKNIVFQSGMSTNGYLLNCRLASKLITYGVSEFQISLDGPEKIHNITRKKVNGKGTYSRIWQNLIDLKLSNLEFKINLRVHISNDNYSQMNDFVDMLSKEFVADSRFRIFLKTIENLGGHNSSTVNCLTKNKKDTIFENLSQIALTNGANLFNPGDSYVCYAGRPTSFVIRRDGSLTKCTIGLDDTENQIGQLNDHGGMDIIQNKIRPWLHGAITNNTEFLQCPRSFVCKKNCT